MGRHGRTHQGTSPERGRARPNGAGRAEREPASGARGPPRAHNRELIALPTIGSASISPDGRYVAYLRSTADLEADAFVAHVWRADTTTSRTVQMTRGSASSSDPLSFHANHRLAIVPTAGGTPRSLTDAFDESATPVAWRHDGTYFAALVRTASHLFRVDPATKTIARVSSPDNLALASASLTRDGSRVTTACSATCRRPHAPGTARRGAGVAGHEALSGPASARLVYRSVGPFQRRVEDLASFVLPIRRRLCHFVLHGRTMGRLSWRGTLLLCGLIANPSSLCATQQKESGHSIGQVSTRGDLIVIELDDAALGQANLFDLVGRTLRISPDGSRYRVTNQSLQWEVDYGAELTAADVGLHRFTFPFSGKRWSSFFVGTTGSIRFAASARDGDIDAYGHVDSGIGPAIGRFDRLADVGRTLGARAPAICVFLKPRMSGRRYVRELPDRVVITWDLTEPFGSLLDFTWFPTINLFQAVLHRDGSIEMSYKTMTAKDAIVGIYPVLSREQTLQSVHLSAMTPKHGPFAAVYESFHYLEPPRPRDLECTVIQALGDKFDFLAYYSDFRIDSQEASSPSDGPIGGHVTGIGNTRHDQTDAILESRCTRGRFQLGLAQPIFVGSNEMQAGPAGGAPVESPHSISFYTRQLSEARSDGKLLPYNYAVGHLGHEVGHRWSAYVAARVNGQTISLGAWPHWDAGLQALVAYPYSLPLEASTEGGGVWQDNFDGTFTQLRDGYFVPAAGYSYLDLYLMGLIAPEEVPDFFVLKSLVRVGADEKGRPIFKGERTKVTIQDVIAAEGPRSPDVNHSQRHFNIGIAVIVEHGRGPSAELIDRANGIRRQWIDYWTTATGHRASMTANPR